MATTMTNVELSENPGFMDRYVAAMFLPHTDMTLFPEMEATLGRAAPGKDGLVRTRTVAVAGKGGTGKTTLTGLIVRALLARGQTPLLAVDADPNANLGEILGTEAPLTVGRVREAAFTGGARDIPEGWDKQSWIEYRMHEAVAEAVGSTCS